MSDSGNSQPVTCLKTDFWIGTYLPATKFKRKENMSSENSSRTSFFQLSSSHPQGNQYYHFLLYPSRITSCMYKQIFIQLLIYFSPLFSSFSSSSSFQMTYMLCSSVFFSLGDCFLLTYKEFFISYGCIIWFYHNLSNSLMVDA